MKYGIYTAKNYELMVTPRFAYELYAVAERECFGTRLYAMMNGVKRLVALCEHDPAAQSTRYAFENDQGDLLGNGKKMEREIAAHVPYTVTTVDKVLVAETELLPVNTPMPVARTDNIRECLRLWRQTGSLNVSEDSLLFTCVLAGVEYVCSMGTAGDNIYCGASINIPANGGMVGGQQYFRIRNYGDNSEPWCQSFCNIGYTKDLDREIDENLFVSGTCNVDKNGVQYWSVKSVLSNKIVLEGCNGDEYTYLSDDRYAMERYR